MKALRVTGVRCRARFGLAVCCVWLVASPSVAQSGCEPYAVTPVSITPVFEEAAYDNQTDLRQLQMLARDTTHAIPHYEQVILGLTRYTPLFEFHAPMIKQAMPDGSFCARAEKLEARIGYKAVTIYVASAFPKGSCDYSHVLTHEEKHIAVNRALLEEFAPRIKQRLEDYLKVYGLFIVPNADYAEKLLHDKVTAIVLEVVGQMMDENARRQKLVDNPQEYGTNLVACQGHVAEVARRFYLSGR